MAQDSQQASAKKDLQVIENAMDHKIEKKSTEKNLIIECHTLIPVSL